MFNATILFMRQYPLYNYLLRTVAVGCILGLSIGAAIALLLPIKRTAVATLAIGSIIINKTQQFIEDPDVVVLLVSNLSFLKKISIQIKQPKFLDLLDPVTGGGLSAGRLRTSNVIVLKTTDYDSERSLLFVTALADQIKKRHDGILKSYLDTNQKCEEFSKQDSISTPSIDDKAIIVSELFKFVIRDSQRLIEFIKCVDDKNYGGISYETKFLDEPYIESYSLQRRVIRFSIISSLLFGLLALGGAAITHKQRSSNKFGVS